MFGPSLWAVSGVGCVSRKTASTPAATAARASGRTIARLPPVVLPPGRWTECVASKTTGWPNAFMIGMHCRSFTSRP